MSDSHVQSVVGLVPAAGSATRLGSPTRSKELEPVWLPPGSQSAMPAMCCLLSAFEAAGVKVAIIALRKEKRDIPATLGARTEGGLRLRYVSVKPTPAPPFTVRAALSQCRDSAVLFGYPDILFEPVDGLQVLLDRVQSAGEDLALGLFPHPAVRRADLVERTADGSVIRITRSTTADEASWSWALAAWGPSFSNFLLDQVAAIDTSTPGVGGLGMGDVINDAIGAGLTVGGETLSTTPFLDIGTPEALSEAYRRLIAR